jgi:hypothetical protein
VTLKAGAAAATNGSYCLVGGFCSTNTQFIGHRIGTYIVEYLNNFQIFNLIFNFTLFYIRYKFTPFNNDEDHTLSIIFHQHGLAPIFSYALVVTLALSHFLYHIYIFFFIKFLVYGLYDAIMHDQGFLFTCVV